MQIPDKWQIQNKAKSQTNGKYKIRQSTHKNNGIQTHACTHRKTKQNKTKTQTVLKKKKKKKVEEIDPVRK